MGLVLSLWGAVLQRQYLNPVTVGVADEVEVHVGVFVAHATHLLVKGTCGLVVAGHTHADVKLAFAEVVRLGMVAQPGQFQLPCKRPCCVPG